MIQVIIKSLDEIKSQSKDINKEWHELVQNNSEAKKFIKENGLKYGIDLSEKIPSQKDSSQVSEDQNKTSQNTSPNDNKENDKEKVVERLALNVDGDCLTESKDKIVWKSTSNIKRLNESLNENDVDVITEEYDFNDDEIVAMVKL